MFDKLLAKIALIIVTTATSIAGMFGLASKTEGPVGATIPQTPARIETSLASKITSSDTSMTLVNGNDKNGNPFNGYICFTIDEGTSSVEDVCGTASSTSVTALTRGIDQLTGTSTVTSLKKAHNRGATVKVTNYPTQTIFARILNGDETLPHAIRYDSTVATSTFTTYNLVNKQYVDGVALQGAPTATGTTPGILQIGTRTQLSSGTAMSGAYTLVPADSYFTYTPVSATSVPVSNSSGKIAQGWLDLTQAFTFSGATTTMSATTSIAASASNKLYLNNVPYVLPSTQGAASTTLTNDGSGNLSWTSKSGFATTSPTTLNLTFTNTTTIQTLIFTPATAQRVLLVGSAMNMLNNTNAGGCRLLVDIDGAGTTTVSSLVYASAAGASSVFNMNFTYLTSQLTAAQHSIRLLGVYNGTGSCSGDTYYNTPSFSALYVGN